MLTIEDSASIRHGIMKRLGKEPGISICSIDIVKIPDGIHVDVRYLIKVMNTRLIVRSQFQLPPIFYLKHVHNEIDEMCEQAKEAKKDFGFTQTSLMAWKKLKGTGLRGRWALN